MWFKIALLYAHYTIESQKKCIRYSIKRRFLNFGKNRCVPYGRLTPWQLAMHFFELPNSRIALFDLVNKCVAIQYKSVKENLLKFTELEFSNYISVISKLLIKNHINLVRFHPFKISFYTFSYISPVMTIGIAHITFHISHMHRCNTCIELLKNHYSYSESSRWLNASCYTRWAACTPCFETSKNTM